MHCWHESHAAQLAPKARPRAHADTGARAGSGARVWARVLRAVWVGPRMRVKQSVGACIISARGAAKEPCARRHALRSRQPKGYAAHQAHAGVRACAYGWCRRLGADGAASSARRVGATSHDAQPASCCMRAGLLEKRTPKNEAIPAHTPRHNASQCHDTKARRAHNRTPCLLMLTQLGRAAAHAGQYTRRCQGRPGRLALRRPFQTPARQRLRITINTSGHLLLLQGRTSTSKKLQLSSQRWQPQHANETRRSAWHAGRAHVGAKAHKAAELGTRRSAHRRV